MTIPTKLTIDLSTLTWGELEEVEKMSSGEAAKALLAGDVWPSCLVALAFVVLRRDNPMLLIEEGRRIPISADIEVIDGAPVDPTKASEGNGSSPTSPPSATSTASGLPSFDG